MIWGFLLVALAALSLHVFVLWRGLLIDWLRLELLGIEAALAAGLPLGAQSSPAVQRLRELVSNSRRFADSLILSRLLLAALLLPKTTRTGLSCRESLSALEDPACRETSLRLYAEFERAVGHRMAAGSPALWLYWIYRRLVPDTLSKAPRIPWLPLLEYTFAEPRLLR